MRSESVNELGFVAAIKAGMAIRSRRTFWIAAVDGSGRATSAYICMYVLSRLTYR